MRKVKVSLNKPSTAYKTQIMNIFINALSTFDNIKRVFCLRDRAHKNLSELQHKCTQCEQKENWDNIDQELADCSHNISSVIQQKWDRIMSLPHLFHQNHQTSDKNKNFLLSYSSLGFLWNYMITTHQISQVIAWVMFSKFIWWFDKKASEQ